MIGGFSGYVVAVDAEARKVTVSCYGVHYEVRVTQHHLEDLRETAKMGDEVRIIARVIYRENEAPHAFGFVDHVARQTFDDLVAIRGVGPKVAMGALDADEDPMVVRRMCEGTLAWPWDYKAVGTAMRQKIKDGWL